MGGFSLATRGELSAPKLFVNSSKARAVANLRAADRAPTPGSHRILSAAGHWFVGGSTRVRISTWIWSVGVPSWKWPNGLAWPNSLTWPI